jgi:WhiB family redox-sensing transcriptional regulator
MARRDWRDDAYCFGMPSELFYGKNELPMTSQEIKNAKTICNKCDVRRDCLITALKDKEEHGVWGGYTSFERRAALARNYGKVQGAMNDYDDKTFVAPRKRKK